MLFNVGCKKMVRGAAAAPAARAARGVARVHGVWVDGWPPSGKCCAQLPLRVDAHTSHSCGGGWRRPCPVCCASRAPAAQPRARAVGGGGDCPVCRAPGSLTDSSGFAPGSPPCRAAVSAQAETGGRGLIVEGHIPYKTTYISVPNHLWMHEQELVVRKASLSLPLSLSLSLSLALSFDFDVWCARQRAPPPPRTPVDLGACFARAIRCRALVCCAAVHLVGPPGIGICGWPRCRVSPGMPCHHRVCIRRQPRALPPHTHTLPPAPRLSARGICVSACPRAHTCTRVVRGGVLKVRAFTTRAK